ncbi:5'-deoxynucleotidase [Paenibacillus cellulosilyticus]|uniref:5'-deoxynucleotidase n=1 Tax=Paenibacillus cellulosilyticus TaxID=375489 RepID=A0A2V2Z0R1_9BACL|nr:5'-deoxynucleotidase [Paenibacillus cellulosilyticus]PWW07131.1 5'-deoxynucleotidase [Paenibacillus cellulosilyticus]QKS44659.1 5'-deoxynucleotidase [Paenibacillus cellulosilyticus]
MESDFFAYMYRLKYIERWSLMRNTTKESVAEHSFHVGLLAHMLCEIGNAIFGRSLNADRAAAMALFHDATEVFTGDIPTPVKHHNPKMLASFREIEAMAAERLHSMVPQPLRGAYASLLGIHDAGSPPSEAEQELRAMLKAADLLDAYLKCVSEVASGNREFAVAKTEIEQKLAQLAMPEVDWFLDRLAPGLGRTLDELSRDDG